MSDYIEVLASIISRTTTEVFFGEPRMNYDEFSTIFKASKYVETLIFYGLRLSKSGKINLGRNISYKIKKLSFQETGLIKYSNWSEDKTEFNCIVEQIINSNIHKQLQKLNILNCNIDIEDMDIPGVELVEECLW